MAIRAVPLAKAHEAKQFSCGNNELNVFLQTTAAQHQRKFYQKYGFIPFPNDPLILFLPFGSMPL